MNPLTREERRKICDSCDPLLTHMLGSTEEDFLNAAPSEAAPEVVPARSLTLVEKTQLQNEIDRTTLFNGAYATREYSPVLAIAQMQRAEEREGLEKLLG